MKKHRFWVIIVIAMFCCALLAGLTACEPLIFNGVPTLGLETNGVSQVDLRSVDYQYEITDYPVRSEGYNFKLTYSTVSATYKFFNGTPADITMPLFLLTGKPEYRLAEKRSDTPLYKFQTDASHRIILRCAYDRAFGEYSDGAGIASVGNFLKSVYVDKQIDDYYNSTLQIYRHSYIISDLQSNARMICVDESQIDNCRLFFDNIEFNSSQYIDGIYYYFFDIGDTDKLTVYSMEKEFLCGSSILFCDESKEVVENGGKLTQVSSGTITFDALALSYYDESGSISETDWYNAVVEYIKINGYGYVNSLSFFDIADKLSYMYQLDLIVPAQSEIALTVEMPLYPTVNAQSYDTDVYEYELDLSSLSNWRGDPDVNVYIKTEGYFVRSSLGLTETTYGYELKKIGLSADNLTFTLSEIPDFDNNTSEDIIVAAILIVFILVPAVTTWTVIWCDNAKRRKAKNKEDMTTATNQ